ncbi:MAG: BatA domain-containing protein, partial [Gemmatimonadales bacterium]|nr:BatA domain-containing protein [Gemmatimonadales bacterium]
MTLASPLWLWGLLGLAVPIAIHLWSRVPADRVKVGSVRLIVPSPLARARSLALRDPWLLLARCLVLALLALGLAEPTPRAGAAAAARVLVAPALLGADGRLPALALLDSLRDAGATVEPLPADTAADLWTLVQRAERALPAGPLMVVAPEDAAVPLAPRPSAGRAVTWRTVAAPARPAAAPSATAASAEVDGDGDAAP